MSKLVLCIFFGVHYYLLQFNTAGSVPAAEARAARKLRMSNLNSKTKAGKNSKTDKVRYCLTVDTAAGAKPRYQCPTNSFTNVDERITDEMVDLCEALHSVEIRRSYKDGSHLLFDVCRMGTTILRYFDYGVVFDLGIESIYMIHNMNGSCTLYGESLKQSEGGKCDTDYDCDAAFYCSVSEHQCEHTPSFRPSMMTEKPFNIPSIRPTSKPTRVDEESPVPTKRPSKAPVPSATTTSMTTTTTVPITSNPTFYSPSASPTSMQLTESPSASPGRAPESAAPTLLPTTSPSTHPSMNPSSRPSSQAPTKQLPTSPTAIPSFTPSHLPSLDPSILSKEPDSCDVDDCDACSVCNSEKLCAPPPTGCLCNSNCPADRPICYRSSGALGTCGCNSDDQCSGEGETCDYSCILSDTKKYCETPESRNEDCEGIDGPGYLCPAGGTKCMLGPTKLPTPRPTRPR